MSKGREVFMARQPIFNRKKEIYGYELLFRTGFDNFFDLSVDQDYASSRTLVDSFMNFGVKDITGGKKAFLNFTGPVLLSEIAQMFSKDILVVELLETVKPSSEVIEAFRNLKSKGYTLALDDFQYFPEFEPLIELSDIIKIDFKLTRAGDRKMMMKIIGDSGKKFLAEKIETHEEFQEAMGLGYSYFQGYFFQKPVIVAGKDVKGYKLNILQIMKELEEDADYGRVEEILRRDVALTYKLLRFINSAAIGVVERVSSVRHAISLLGVDEFRKWVIMMMMIRLGEDKPEALMKHSIIRATFCESLATILDGDYKASDYFLLGLFSLIDAYLDRPMDEIVLDLPIADHIKDALLGKENSLSRILDIFRGIEASSWDEVSSLCTLSGIDEKIIGQVYLEAIMKGENYY